MDLAHRDVTGVVTDVRLKNDAKRADVTVETADGERDFELRRFAFSQLLKFADMRKSHFKNEEGEIVHARANDVVDALDEQELVFKASPNAESADVPAVVSTRYVSLPSEEIADRARETITSMGYSDFDFYTLREGQVVEMRFEFEGEELEASNRQEVLGPGIQIRNSMFGASSLRVNSWYRIERCSNGMLLMVGEEPEYRRVHVGEEADIRELLDEQIRIRMENISEVLEDVDRTVEIDLSLDQQIEWLEAAAENRRITKTMAGEVAAGVLSHAGEDPAEWESEVLTIPDSEPDDEWNTGEENLWGFINAFTGYVEHNEVSDSASRDAVRVYNELLESETIDDVEAVAA